MAEGTTRQTFNQLPKPASPINLLRFYTGIINLKHYQTELSNKYIINL